MLNKRISELLNRQLNAELHSAYLYLAFESSFDRTGLDGFANWYNVQSREELDHAMILYRYLTDNGEIIRFDAIEDVSADGMGVLGILNEARAHEEHITEMINSLYSEASSANDRRTLALLEWFIAEQAEEEKNAGDMVQKFLLYGLCNSCSDCSIASSGGDFGLCGGGLHALNGELSKRAYKAAAYPLG